MILIIPLVPVPSIDIIALNNQTVGQSLTLESTVTTVRGITSRVDIVWSSNGVELRRIRKATANSTHDNTELYVDSYNIPLLTTTDDGRLFKCEIVIMANPTVVVAYNVTLDVIGKYYKVLSCDLLYIRAKRYCNFSITIDTSSNIHYTSLRYLIHYV